jgi:ADP-heptose:LPS heptosyltransferase
VRSADSDRRALVLCAGGGIGDSLFASVVARALHRRYARVDAFALPFHRAALERVPDFDEILSDDGGEERTVAAQLARRAYTAAVVTWATARIARVARQARIPVRVGQARRLYSGLFTKRVNVRSERGDVTSHWTQILLDYARALDCDTADAHPRFVPTEDDEMRARAVMERHGLVPGEFAIVHPCNAIASYVAWPTAGWSALARSLRDVFGLKIAVTGSESDVASANAMSARDDTIVSLAGETSIGAFGALAAHARAFVGITTGSMHVAAAVGCPTVGIFPFQSDFPERWAPLGKKTEIVRASYPCRPGDTKERCRANYACIQHLDVGRIVAAAEALLR